MTTQIEALKLALEALKLGDTVFYPQTSIAIAAIECVLAQPEQEPVAWEEGESIYFKEDQGLNDWIRANGTPLYRHPPQRTWVGLTDEEWLSLECKSVEEIRIGLAIQAKLKEKNT